MYKIESLLHPGLIHFGIGLVLFGWVFYTFTLFFKKNDMAFQKFSFFLLLLGGLGTLLALLTGMLFVGHYTGEAGEFQQIHKNLAHLTFFAVTVTCMIKVVALVRYKNVAALPWLTFIFYTFSAMLIGMTGYLGGNLAYGVLMKGGLAPL